LVKVPNIEKNLDQEEGFLQCSVHVQYLPVDVVQSRDLYEPAYVLMSEFVLEEPNSQLVPLRCLSTWDRGEREVDR
jgi:hypothetical protein